MKVSLYFYLNEEKKNSRKQSIPIYIRVRLNGKKAEGRLYHADILEKEKLLWDKRTMRLTDTRHKANKFINTVQKEFDAFIILNGRSINRYTSLSILDYLLGRNKPEESTIVTYMITSLYPRLKTMGTWLPAPSAPMSRPFAT
jgi:hypothetical protein